MKKQPKQDQFKVCERNGQLVIALNSEILLPENAPVRHEAKYAEVTVDSGYESLDNYLYLEDNGQVSFMKPANHETQKTK